MQDKEQPPVTEQTLDVFRQTDILAAGLTPEQAEDIPDDVLAELADYSVATSSNFIGA